MDNDNIAWHYYPVRSSDFFIRVDLSNHGMPGQFEQLWVKKVGENRFEVCCLPFFAYGIALGDTVQTDDEFALEKVITKSGHKTLRVAVVVMEKQDQVHLLLHDWVANSGRPCEWYSPGYLSVDLPPGSDEGAIMSGLEKMIDNSEIAVEIVE